MEGFVAFLTLWTWNNLEFIHTKNEQLAQGYHWEELAECREPDESVPHFWVFGKVCYKLVK